MVAPVHSIGLREDFNFPRPTLGEQHRISPTTRSSGDLARLETSWQWFLTVPTFRGSIDTIISLRLTWYERFVFLIVPGSSRSKSMLVKRLVSNWLHTTRDNYLA